MTVGGDGFVGTEASVRATGSITDIGGPIVRHAGARKALIRLAVEDGRARLVVEDDGVGCGLSASAAASGALPQAVDGEGHGIAGMAERVHLLGGTFSAGDRAGGGFRVVACLPMKGAEA